MHRTLRLGVAALGLTLTLHASPATAEVEPVGDAKLVFKLYDAHATTMRRARYGRVVAFGILGSGAVVTAALGVPQDPFARSYLAIAGTSALLASLLNLGIPTSAEHTA